MRNVCAEDEVREDEKTRGAPQLVHDTEENSSSRLLVFSPFGLPALTIDTPS